MSFFIPYDVQNFAGTATGTQLTGSTGTLTTSQGTAWNVVSAAGGNPLFLSLDGSGDLDVIAGFSGSYYSNYCYKGIPAYSGTVPFQVAASVKFTWNANLAADYINVVARLLSPLTGAGGFEYECYRAYFINGSGLNIASGNSNLISNGNTGTLTAGHNYILTLYITGLSGTSTLLATLVDASAPSTILQTVTTTDNTAALNNQSSTYYWGIEAPYGHVDSHFSVQGFTGYAYAANAAAGTISGGTVNSTGGDVSVNIQTYGGPMSPPYTPAGFAVQARPNVNTPWVNFPITQANVTGTSSPVVGLLLANPIPAGWLAQVIYSPGNVVDSSATPVALTATAGTALTNNSTSVYNSELKGVMVLGTRGFASVIGDTNYSQSATTSSAPYGSTSNTGYGEAQTLHKQELPYGAAPGWQVVYQGFSGINQSLNNTNGAGNIIDSIVLIGAAVWIQEEAGGPIVKFPVTFNGAAGVTIAHNTIVECDPIEVAVMPGANVWTAQWYKPLTPTTPLPYCTQLYTYDNTGLESNDGCIAGSVGTLTNILLTGGFLHAAPIPSAGVSYVGRGWQSMALVGQPHPSYTGTTIVLMFTGDSIVSQQLDNDQASTYSDANCRGWQGRYCYARHPQVTFGNSGSASSAFTQFISSAKGGTGASTDPAFQYLFGEGSNSRKITHWVNEFGINSMRTNNVPSTRVTAQWADRQAVAAIAANYSIPYVHTTLTPCLGYQVSNDFATLTVGSADFTLTLGYQNGSGANVSGTTATISHTGGAAAINTALNTFFGTSGGVYATGSGPYTLSFYALAQVYSVSVTGTGSSIVLDWNIARQAFNNEVRTSSVSGITGCIGFIDACCILETDGGTASGSIPTQVYQGSGNNTWNPADTNAGGTGIHPNTQGHIDYADCVIDTVFTNNKNDVPPILVANTLFRVDFGGGING